MSSTGGVWKKTLVYLGLVEEPEEYDDLPEQMDEPRRRPEPQPARDRDPDPHNVRPLRMSEPGSPHVRAMPATSTVRVTVVAVQSFDDAETIGSRYRMGQPVVIDLREVDTAVARRVLDFVGGVTYALHGRIAPAGQRAFALLPEGIELPQDEQMRLAEQGYEVRA